MLAPNAFVQNRYLFVRRLGGGLGCTTWNVRLISIPNTKIQANTVNVTNLNGGRFTSAEVRFKLRG
jgi:hypothetical protein